VRYGLVGAPCGGEDGSLGSAKPQAAVENERASLGPSAFGSLLRGYRLAAGLSQEVLAERARISAQGIGALERVIGVRRSVKR